MKNTGEAPIPPETEYLISDIEELVNLNVDKHLDGYPFKITAANYTPILDNGKAPIGVNRLNNTYVSPIVHGSREFTGMDLLFTFPMAPGNENPINISLKWSDDIQCRLAVVDRRPVLLVERGKDSENTLFAASPKPDEMTSYFNSIGLPESIWKSDLKELIQDLDNSNDIRLKRSSKTSLDPFTNFEIVHDARYMKNNDDEQELVQELCINLDHLDAGTLGNQTEMYIPPTETFRNMLRFERNDTGDEWIYKGAYSGKLTTGELVDELEQLDPKLGIPNGKIFDKALNALSQEPY